MFKNIIYSILIFTFILTAFNACGKRGLPAPPTYVVPAAITDLKLDVTPAQRFLVWTIPSANQDQSRPADLSAFKVLMKIVPSDQDSCLFCDEGFQNYRTVSLSRPVEGFIRGTSFFFPSPEVPEGLVYVFSVISLNRSNWSGAVSNKLALHYLPAVAPPAGLTGRPSASVVELTWQVPICPSAYSDNLCYRVYRRPRRSDAAPWLLITPEPLRSPEYIDVGLNDWSACEYAVTSLLISDSTAYESDYSSPVPVTPGDYTAPATPENFMAFPFQGVCQLLWNASLDADLAGYRVYRRDPVSGIDRLLAVLPPRQHEYTDTAIFPGRTYFYSVSAFDLSDRHNESQRTAEIAVVLP